MTRQLRTLPYWVLFAVELGLILPIVFAVPAAFFGPGHSAFEATAGLGGFFGTAISQRIRQRDFWRLARPRRRRVAFAASAGSTTGEPDLDRIAVSLLEDRVRSWPADRWLLPPLAVGCVAVPLIAAYRTVWPWVFAELAVVAIAGLGVSRLTGEDPRVRLDRLRTSMLDVPR